MKEEGVLIITAGPYKGKYYDYKIEYSDDEKSSQLYSGIETFRIDCET